MQQRIGWTWEQDRLRYWIAPVGPPPTDATLISSQLKLQNMKNDLQLFQYKVDAATKDLNNRLTDLRFCLEAKD